jgi:hypothetical protein
MGFDVKLAQVEQFGMIELQRTQVFRESMA